MTGMATTALLLHMQVVVAKLQTITVREFLPALGITMADLRRWVPKTQNPNISVEFLMAYRMGHDMIRNNVGSRSVTDLFDGEKFFKVNSANGTADQQQAGLDMGNLVIDVTNSRAGALDGKVSNALRNLLFGAFGEDLATRSMYRSAEIGMVPYEKLVACYNVTADPNVCSLNIRVSSVSVSVCYLWQVLRLPTPFASQLRTVGIKGCLF
jgi:hypothetical protein